MCPSAFSITSPCNWAQIRWASSATRSAGVVTDKASRKPIEGLDGSGAKGAPHAGFGHEARREHQSVEFDIRFAERDIGKSHRF